MSNALKPFLMIINDKTGDFVDIKKIQGIVVADGMSNILLSNEVVVISPLKPRELWSRINTIRHKHGQVQRLNQPSTPTSPKKSILAGSVDTSDTISPRKK